MGKELIYYLFPWRWSLLWAVRLLLFSNSGFTLNAGNKTSWPGWASTWRITASWWWRVPLSAQSVSWCWCRAWDCGHWSRHILVRSENWNNRLQPSGFVDASVVSTFPWRPLTWPTYNEKLQSPKAYSNYIYRVHCTATSNGSSRKLRHRKHTNTRTHT